MAETNEQELQRVLQKLAKWRTVFASWQLGTRASSDPECQAVKDQRELLIFLRLELNALTATLAKTGVIKQSDYQDNLLVEAKALDAAYEEKFPGFTTDEFGVRVDMLKAKETTKGWRP